MWVWDQSAGQLFASDINGIPNGLVSKGYSGKDRGKNNPSLQNVVGVGPIPAGEWNIGEVYNSKSVGPYAIVLTPRKSTETFGRSAFRIHGDSIKSPGSASRGCIILPRNIREKIIKSRDKHLRVIA